MTQKTVIIGILLVLLLTQGVVGDTPVPAQAESAKSSATIEDEGTIAFSSKIESPNNWLSYENNYLLVNNEKTDIYPYKVGEGKYIFYIDIDGNDYAAISATKNIAGEYTLEKSPAYPPGEKHSPLIDSLLKNPEYLEEALTQYDSFVSSPNYDDSKTLQNTLVVITPGTYYPTEGEETDLGKSQREAKTVEEAVAAIEKEFKDAEAALSQAEKEASAAPTDKTKQTAKIEAEKTLATLKKSQEELMKRKEVAVKLSTAEKKLEEAEEAFTADGSSKNADAQVKARTERDRVKEELKQLGTPTKAPTVQPLPDSIPADFKGVVIDTYSSQFRVGDFYKTESGEFKRISTIKLKANIFGGITGSTLIFADGTKQNVEDTSPSKIIQYEEARSTTTPGETPVEYVQKNVADAEQKLKAAEAKPDTDADKAKAVAEAKELLDKAKKDEEFLIRSGALSASYTSGTGGTTGAAAQRAGTQPPASGAAPVAPAQSVASTNIKVGELYENDVGFFYVTDVSDKDKIQVDFYKKDGTAKDSREYPETSFSNIKKNGIADSYVLGAIPTNQRLDSIKSLTSSGNFEGIIKTLKNLRDKTPTSSLYFQNNEFSVSYIDTSSEDRIKKRTDVFNVQSGERTIHSEEIVTKDKAPTSKTETTETQKLDGDTLKPLSTKKEYFDLDDKGKFTSVMSFTNDRSPADSATSMALKQKLEGKMRDWEKANTAFIGEQNEQNQNALDLADKELNKLQKELAIAQSTKSANQILTRLSGNTYITETFEKDGKKSYKSYKIGTDGSLEEVSPAEVYFAVDKESRKEGLFSSFFLSDAAKDIMNELQKEGAIGSFLGIERSTMSSAAKFVGGLLSASDQFSGLSAFSNLFRDHEIGRWKEKVYKEFTTQVVGMQYFKSKICEKKFKNNGGQSFLVQKTGGEYKAGAYIQVDKSEKITVKGQDNYIYRTTFSLNNPDEQDMVYNVVLKTNNKQIPLFTSRQLVKAGQSVKQTMTDLTLKDKTIIPIFTSKANYVEACLEFTPPITTLAGKRTNKHCNPITTLQGGTTSYTKKEQDKAETPSSTTTIDWARVIEGD